MTRTDLCLYLISQGFNEKALKILSFKELERITILTIALNWGELELKK